MGEGADEIGTVVTGGIVAGAVEQAAHGGGGRIDGDDTAAGARCLNCAAMRVGEFCHVCGQSGHVHRTISAIGHDILHGVFHFEGKLWATLPMLVLHPGDLTRRYVHGQRVRFVAPMALFLFSVFLLFAAVNRVAMPDVAGIGQGVARAQVQMRNGEQQSRAKLADLLRRRGAALAADPHADVRAIDKGIATLRSEIATLSRLSGSLPSTTVGPGTGAGPGDVAASLETAGDRIGPVDTGWAPLDRQIEHVRENPALYAYKLKMGSYKFSWVLIPISVPLIWLLFFWRRDVGLFDHAIFAIYSLSFMTLLVVGLIGLYLAGVPAGWLWLALVIAPPLHMYRQIRGAYRTGRLGAAWRTIALLMMTGVASGLFCCLLLWLEAD